MVKGSSKNDLIKKEVREILEDSFSLNAITLGNITIQSSRASLIDIEKSIERLLKKHKDFIVLDKENKMRGGNYTG